MGKSDIEKMRNDQLSGGRLNIRFKGFRNSFKSRVTPAAGEAQSLNQIQLSEYTGAKPFRIFQTGGEIAPVRARTLTVLAPGARNAAGGRKIGRKELRDMVRAGEAEIIQTKSGPAIVKPQMKLTKKGTYRRGAKVIILAWLRKLLTEKQRIDFFGNFESNSPEHERILAQAGDEAIQATLEQKQ